MPRSTTNARRSQRRIIATALVAAALMSAAARASQRRPVAWEELAFRSDLLAVVECTTAGIDVARFRVLDSWKGPAEGAEFTLRIGGSGRGVVAALVGEQYLAAGFRAGAAPPAAAVAFANPNPLAWRALPADFAAPAGRRLVPLPEDVEPNLRSFVFAPATLAGLRRDVAEFLRRPPAEQEARSIRGAAHIFFAVTKPGPAAERAGALLRSVDAAGDVAAIAAVLLAAAAQPEWRETPPYTFVGPLGEAGGPLARAALEAIPVSRSDERSKPCRWALSALGEHLDPAPAAAPPRSPPPLEEWLARFAPECARASVQETADALLCWRGGATAYAAISAFGHACGEGRAELLRALGNAADPWVRAGAGVYLALEDPLAARPLLEREQLCPGPTGALAALALAGRGDARAVDRLVEFLGDRSGGGPDAFVLRNLQFRVRVLLSNSAARAGVEQPEATTRFQRDLMDPGEPSERAHAHYRAWWARHRGEVVPFDPWLEELALQRID